MVIGSEPRPETLLASFHAQALEHLARTGAFAGAGPSDRLCGIFESLEQFRLALTSGTPHVGRYSLSWSVYRGWRKTASVGKAIARPSEDRILIWDLSEAGDFRSAVEDGVHALVADDVDTKVRFRDGSEPGVAGG
jgi:hypothetical protein